MNNIVVTRVVNEPTLLHQPNIDIQQFSYNFAHCPLHNFLWIKQVYVGRPLVTLGKLFMIHSVYKVLPAEYSGPLSVWASCALPGPVMCACITRACVAQKRGKEKRRG